jgi:hypothetical protein
MPLTVCAGLSVTPVTDPACSAKAARGLRTTVPASALKRARTPASATRASAAGSSFFVVSISRKPAGATAPTGYDDAIRESIASLSHVRGAAATVTDFVLTRAAVTAAVEAAEKLSFPGDKDSQVLVRRHRNGRLYSSAATAVLPASACAFDVDHNGRHGRRDGERLPLTRERILFVMHVRT